MNVYIDGQRLILDPKDSIGSGGEADIYEVGGSATKIFRVPRAGSVDSSVSLAVANKLAEYQTKLPDLISLSSSLPQRVIKPEKLVKDDRGNIIGYTMPLVKNGVKLSSFADKVFREQSGIDYDQVRNVYLDLHNTVSRLHQIDMLIGDFNYFNVLVKDREPYLIDIDSSQFGSYLANMFNTRFVDPTLCELQTNKLTLMRPYIKNSDWYSFAAMLLECLLYLDPYGGVYRHNGRTLSKDQRIAQRISIFRPDVLSPPHLPKPHFLSDELLRYFVDVVNDDQRGVFPKQLLEEMEWKQCNNCQTLHCRRSCPNCTAGSLEATRDIVVIRGNVSVNSIFRTTGVIINANFYDGKLMWVYHENNTLMREDKEFVKECPLSPTLKVRFNDKSVYVSENHWIEKIELGGVVQRISSDTYESKAVFDVNQTGLFWSKGGFLYKEGSYGPQRLGSVLEKRTQIWLGPTHGFGLYRAGELVRAFIFRPDSTVINDSLSTHPMPGELLDSNALFGPNKIWFFTTTSERGRQINRVSLYDTHGKLIAYSQAEKGDGSWLSEIKGKLCLGEILLSTSIDGIVRVDVSGRDLVKTKEFGDTKTFVSNDTLLFPSNLGGIYVVSSREVSLIKIS